MTKTISGILLKAEAGAEPMPIPVSDHTSIQQYVGGWFDCVQENYKASQFLLETDDEFTAVGYVHDEGIILGLPLNKMATIIFRRELFGDVVIVSGTSPEGEYDGDNYDVPSWFCDAVFGGSLANTVDELDSKAGFLRDALLRGVREGLIDMDMADSLVLAMASAHELEEHEMEAVGNILDTMGRYHMARLMGMPAFSKELLGRIDDLAEMIEASEQWQVTDDELSKFLSESDGE